MYDVFVSYAADDLRFVANLVRTLRAIGWRVFWAEDLAAGEDFRQAIERQLQACPCILVVWSQASVSSDWVIAEATVGRKRKCLVPIVLDSAEPPREFGAKVNIVNLSGWNGDRSDYHFEKAVRGIRMYAGEPHEVATGTPVYATAEDDWLASRSEDPACSIPASTRLIEMGNLASNRLAVVYNNRGAAHYRTGNTAQATRDFSAAISIDPGNALFYSNRGGLYWNQSDEENAMRDLGRAICLNPGQSDSYYLLGRMYLAQNKYALAISFFDLAVSVEPLHLEALYYRGQAFENVNSRKAAIDDYTLVATWPAWGSDEVSGMKTHAKEKLQGWGIRM